LLDALIVVQRSGKFQSRRDRGYDRNDKLTWQGQNVVDSIYIYTWHDGFALTLFVLCWYLYTLAVAGSFVSRSSLNSLMNHERARWMSVMTSRELRVIDTSPPARFAAIIAPNV
jgi:Protein of unknown function, DUF599